MAQSTRRQVLRAGAVAVGSVVALSSTAAAAEPPERPDHIHTVSDDPAELAKWQPALHASYSTRQEMRDIYGWKAESDNYETDAYYYWLRYPSQSSAWEEWLGLDGAWFGAADAHLKDHEPFIAFVKDGALDSVVFSSGHHYADELTADEANLTDGQHANLAVDPTHHHFNHQGAGDGALPSEFLDGVESWLDARKAWYENGVYAKSSEDAVEDPWAARERGMWWAEDTRDAKLKGIYQTLNLGGAGDVARDL